MKRTTLLFALSVISIFFFTGCDKLKDQKFSTTIEVRFPVVASSENPGEMIIDLSQLADVLEKNPDLAEHKDKIKSYSLVGIKYKVFEYWNSPESTLNNPATTFTGSIGFGSKDMTAPGVEYQIQNLNLQESMNQTDLSVMTMDNSVISQIQQYFLDTDALKLFLKGNISQNPVDFKVYMQIDVDAIAEIKK